MPFKRISPSDELKNIIECYWIVENSDPTPIVEKIIPDGFPELIFHYGDPYMIRLKNDWQLQTTNLFAGQIREHFHLRNTGVSGVIGVKMRPTAPTQLYGISADAFTNKVVDLSEISTIDARLYMEILRVSTDHEQMISILNQHFRALSGGLGDGVAEKAVDMIFNVNGMIPVTDLCSALYVTERQLERIFKQYIGLSPKFYCRIVRFNYIFQCMQQEKITWSDVVYQAGFYDQSHFIRNFKAFTGEEPTSYLFEKRNLANFFLWKKEEL